MFKIEIQGNSMEDFKKNLTEIVMIYFPLQQWTEPKQETVMVPHVVPSVQPQQMQPVQIPLAPTIQVPIQMPVQQAQPAPVQAAPVSVPSYTLDQLAVAATALVDSGRMGELQQLLANFGVQAMTQLPKEQYGNFSTALRGMGVNV